MKDVAQISTSYARNDPYACDSPYILQCLEYWHGLKGERFAPAWQDFEWKMLPAKIIRYCGVVDVKTNPMDFVYRFWGTAHATVHGVEMTGKSVMDIGSISESRSVFDQYRETLEAKTPQLFTNSITSGQGQNPMEETSLRLPFSDGGETVNHLFAYSDISQHMKKLEEAFNAEIADSFAG